MHTEIFSETKRALATREIANDLVIVGGGLAGVCCAITAARQGLKVALVQDRPVLGGNASSEVRLWVLGATSHMGNNNRWAREGGVIDEFLVENMYRNPEGNPVLVDAMLLEMVSNEPNITLLLNTAVHDLDKSGPDAIRSVRAFCSQNSTVYDLSAPLFVDASGDGVVGFMAGAAFRMGAESKDEFGERFAPTHEYGELLGHSLYFYSRDTGRPVRFVPPSFAMQDITRIPRYRSFNTKEFGCRLWWIEHGGRMDTVHDTERIKWELWKVVYGVWNHIKNSGEFPDAANLTLEWVGMIPGKRESRRFEGDYMLIQQDIVEQRRHDDAVSFGGWSIDLHPADGVFSERPGCNQWHSKGVYQIPYRCMYSRNIRNLFLAGRTISASHVAFGSSRVMATCAANGQAVGMAAVACKRHGLLPRDLAGGERLRELQRDMIRVGQYIPGVALDDAEDIAREASISASSEFELSQLPADGPSLRLDYSWGMMIPVSPGPMPRVSFIVDADGPTSLRVELRVSSKTDNHTPDVTLGTQTIDIGRAGGGRTEAKRVSVDFGAAIPDRQYAFVCLMANPLVSVRCTQTRVTGILSLTNRHNPAVAKAGAQQPPDNIGIDGFEFWCPARRPGGHNIAISLDPPIRPFAAKAIVNGLSRPTGRTNAWVADPNDSAPTVTLEWDRPRTIRRIELGFDADWDHPAESVLMGHPETVMPFCVRRYRVVDDGGRVVAECENNHQTRNTIRLAEPVTTRKLVVQLDHPGASVPAALFEVRCYER